MMLSPTAGSTGTSRSARLRATSSSFVMHFAARLRERAWMLLLSGVLLVGCDAVLPTAAAMEGASAPPEAQEFVTLVNRHRAANGCGPLAWHTGTADVALTHSQDMAARNFFSHTNPDGLSPFARLARAGISFRTAGENLANGWQTPQTVFQAWLDSPSHRANIENCAYTHHGMGVYQNRWTHLFLRP